MTFAPPRRTSAAVALALAVAGAGTGAVLLSRAHPLLPVLDLPWWGLLVAYLVAERVTLGFPRHRDSVLVGLTQLPLALGVLLVAAPAHLAVAWSRPSSTPPCAGAAR